MAPALVADHENSSYMFETMHDHVADVPPAPLTKLPIADREGVLHPVSKMAKMNGSRGERIGSLLQVSPYDDRQHLLDLSDVSYPNQLLAKALKELEATREDYATAAYRESFNWPVVIECLRSLLGVHKDFQWHKQSFFVVVFRSQIPLSTPRSHLMALDRFAHAEATAGGGLLKYWFGEPDDTGRNLATCVWRDRSDAIEANGKPAHRKAAKAANALYTEWKIERLRLTIGKDAEQWSMDEWKIQEHEVVS